MLVQFLLVDLRCHGESASVKKGLPHTVAAAARDVLNLVGINFDKYKFVGIYGGTATASFLLGRYASPCPLLQL